VFEISILCEILRLFRPDNFLVEVVALIAWFIDAFSPQVIITLGPRVVFDVEHMQ